MPNQKKNTMALFGKSSSNPAMGNKVYEKVLASSDSGQVMTVKGAVIKTVLLVLMTIFAASFTWNMVYSPASTMSSINPWIWGGGISGFVIALVIIFVPKMAQYLSPIYAIAEGFFLGAISALFEIMFAESFPGIVLTAISITMLTTLVMLFTYQTGLIKVTQKFRSVIIIATMSVAIFYVAVILLNLFGVNTAFYHSNSLLSIGISVVIVIIAALNLLLDFDFIEKGAEVGAPKYMEWYIRNFGYFGLAISRNIKTISKTRR